MKKIYVLMILVILILVSEVYSKNWPHQKFGLFIHYGWGGTPADSFGYPITQYKDGTYPSSVDAVADSFNVELFAESVAKIKPEYVIFTIWHGGMYPLFPSKTMDKWVGEGHCSKRDLIGEVIDALNELGIDVILYTQPDAARRFSPEDQAAVNYTGKNNPIFNDFVNEIYTEIIERYGSKISGFWFDNGSHRAAIDKARLRETILSRLPDATLISIYYANELTDYGCAEIKRPARFGPNEGYDDVDPNDVDTWPGLSKSVAFVNDQNWWSVPGNYSLDPIDMYKYTVLEAATCTEGGGVAWAIGPFPGDDMWNPRVMPSMTELAQRIEEVRESIKNTYTSISYPAAAGTRIKDLEWGVATESVDRVYEYIHVFYPPEDDTLRLPPPADSAKFYDGINLRTKHRVTIEQNDKGVVLVLDARDSWDTIHSVIRLRKTYNDSSTTLIKETDKLISNEELNVYPNPTRDNFVINLSKEELSYYMIYDINGKIVCRGGIKGVKTEVDISKLPVGIYLVKVGNKSRLVYKCK